MKKFFNDNIHLFVILAIALAGFAVWRINKANKENGTAKDNTTDTDTKS